MSIGALIDIFLHAPKYLDMIFSQYSVLAYLFLFLLIFLETGVVITPFLPGDSILFGVGAIAAASTKLNTPLLIITLMAAAVIGDTVNYHIGVFFGEKIRNKEKIRFIKQEHIQKTQDFFERHGGKTITLARFVPIVRTFAPFVSGASSMKYSKFIMYNLIGGVAWVSLLFGIGYFFGNINLVKDNFGFVTIGIIIVSLIPLIVTFINERKLNKVKDKG